MMSVQNNATCNVGLGLSCLDTYVIIADGICIQF